MNGNIYVFGGQMFYSFSSNSFEIYNPHENKWVASSSAEGDQRCYIDAIVIEKNSELYKQVFEESTNTIIH